MKNESTGGSPANNADRIVEERLSRHFATELEQAGRDYSTLGRRREAAKLQRRHGLTWPRLAVPIVAVAVLAIGGLVGLGLASKPSGVPAAPGGPTVALGADGIPNQIDGRQVYRVRDQAAWQDINGTFLLGGYVFKDMSDCTNTTSSQSDLADSGFMPVCGGYGLGPIAGSDVATGGLNLGNPDDRVLKGWIGEPVVALVKTCMFDDGKTRCGSMVSQVVWPALPDTIAGERVYRAADGTFPTSASFLLGGRFAKPTVVPPCPAPIGKSQAEQQLIAYCFIQTIDGLQLAPMSTIDEPNDEVLVARVHVNDALAAQCPAEVLADCQAGIVVESVVWKSAEAVASSTAPIATSPAQVGSAEGSGATVASPPSYLESPTPGIGQLDKDGVPSSVEGQAVYRAGNLPDAQSFLLGGVIGHGVICAVPSAQPSIPSGCEYWTIDGLVVGNLEGLPVSRIGSVIVAKVVRSDATQLCASGPCLANATLLNQLVVWTGPEVPPPPAGPVPAPS